MNNARTVIKASWRRRLYRELHDDVDALLAKGWRITTSANGFKLYNSLGHYALTIHSTPSDRRAVHNYRATLKKKIQEEEHELRCSQAIV